MRWPGEQGLDVSAAEREGRLMFDREAKKTIQLLEALRQHVARGFRCDIALFEDLTAVRREVEALADKAEKLSYNVSIGIAHSKHQMPNIYRGKSLKKRPRQRQAAAPSQRSPSPSQQASAMEQTPLCGTSCSDRGSGATPVPWFDLVRPVPAVSMKELCRPQTSLSDILDGGDSRLAPSAHRSCHSTTPSTRSPGRFQSRGPGRPDRGMHPPRPATCTPTLTGQRRPPSRMSPTSFEETASVASVASGAREVHQAVPQRPASSLDAAPRYAGAGLKDDQQSAGEEAMASQAQGLAEGEEPEDTSAGAVSLGMLETLSGELHITASVEFEPGEISPIRPQHLDFQVAESSKAAAVEVWPASLLVPIGGGDCGGVVLEVGHAGLAELRVLIAGPGGQESTRVPLVRVVESVGASGQAVPLEWAVDDRCIVHLRAALFLEEAGAGQNDIAGGGASSTTAGSAAATASPAVGDPITTGEKAGGPTARASLNAPGATAAATSAPPHGAKAPHREEVLPPSRSAATVPRPPMSSREEPPRRSRPSSTATPSASSAPGTGTCRAASHAGTAPSPGITSDEAEAVAAYVRRTLLRGSCELRRRAARQGQFSGSQFSGPPTPVRSRPQSASYSRPQSAASRPRSAGVGRHS